MSQRLPKFKFMVPIEIEARIVIVLAFSGLVM